MSDEIKVGDVRISRKGNEIRVLAIDGKHFWGQWDDEHEPRTHSLEWAHDWTKPKPDFFEENATYRSVHTGCKWTVWHVHKMAQGKVAVVQSTDDIPNMFNQSDWDSGHYEKV